jgi:hypothetical protein
MEVDFHCGPECWARELFQPHATERARLCSWVQLALSSEQSGRQTARNNAWSMWMSHGTPGPYVFGSPVVAPSSDGRLELIVVGEDDAPWRAPTSRPRGAKCQGVRRRVTK